MYRKALLFSQLVFAFAISHAQLSVGVQTGASSNYLNTNVSNRASTQITTLWGYFIGLPLQYKVNDWLSFRATPNLAKKNYDVRRTDSLTGVYARQNNTYLQLPIAARLTYGGRLQMFASLGGYIAYWLAGRQKGKTPNVFGVSSNGQQAETYQLSPYDQKYVFNPQRDNRLELGWVLGGGLQYRLQKGYRIFLDCTYYQSLSDQQKAYMVNQVPQYNQTFLLSVGGMYQF